MLPQGTTLAGYRIDRMLGQGGMGTVYEATQLSLDRVVALKLLAAHLSNDMAFRARFRREGQVQARLEHPHVVTVYEAGETEQGLFIAMRLVRGRTLKELINAREVDVARTLKILTPVADALDEAHGMGLIHRDIKPQNVLVGRRDHSFLADFGLTKGPTEASLTKTGHFVGTFDYISPEQINGESATAASDVYSLAGVLYECLTGAVPFPKQVEAAVLYAHVADPPPKPSDTRPELPRQLDDVIARAMAKNPAERHGSASELIEETERALARGSDPAAQEQETALSVRDRTAPSPTAPAPTPAPATAASPPAAAAPPAARAPAAAAPPAPATPPGARAARSPAALPLLGVGALVLVVAGGFLIGKSMAKDEDPPAAKQGAAVTAGNLSARAPSGWKAAQRTVRGVPGLSQDVSIVPTGDALASITIGTSRARPPTLLPRGLVSGSPSKPNAVQLGELEALQYEELERKSDSVRVYAAPLSGGAVATVACVLKPDATQAEVDTCDATAASLTLNAGAPGTLDMGYSGKLDKTIAKLNATTRKRASALAKATTSPAQASAATALQGAYRKAAAQLRHATAEPSLAASNAEVVSALDGLAAGYGRLAKAARAENSAAYGRAQQDIDTGERQLAKALGG
jgi:serine/threonine-protein kinase